MTRISLHSFNSTPPPLSLFVSVITYFLGYFNPLRSQLYTLTLFVPHGLSLVLSPNSGPGFPRPLKGVPTSSGLGPYRRTLDVLSLPRPLRLRRTLSVSSQLLLSIFFISYFLLHPLERWYLFLKVSRITFHIVPSLLTLCPSLLSFLSVLMYIHGSAHPDLLTSVNVVLVSY